MKTARLMILTLIALAMGGWNTQAAPSDAPDQGGGVERPKDERGVQRPPMQAMHPQGPGREQLKQAGATDAQIQSVMDAEFEMQKKRIDLQAAVDKAQLTLEHLLQATTTDEKAVMQAVDAVNQARDEMFKMEIASRLKMKQLLGDATLQKLQEQIRPPMMMQAPGRAMGPDAAERSPRDEGPRAPRADWPRPPAEGGR